jgi:hypothetical protein
MPRSQALSQLLFGDEKCLVLTKLAPRRLPFNRVRPLGWVGRSSSKHRLLDDIGVTPEQAEREVRKWFWQ